MSQFAAGASFIGYAYQVRIGLLLALTRDLGDSAESIRFESLDDVSFHDGAGIPLEILQTKHHVAHAANLSNASNDLWKTIRIWAETADAQRIETKLYLITTATSADGSASAKLRSGAGRDPAKAAELLAAIAQTSENQANAAGYKAFLKLNPRSRETLLESAYVIDQFHSISDLESQIDLALRWACPQQPTAFRERLEQWWYLRAVDLLMGHVQHISMAELESHVVDLQQQFLPDNLPIDEGLYATEVDSSEFAERLFVRQAEIAGVSPVRILKAIQDYFRAMQQRSKWMREELLLVGELKTYETRLVDEWERYFARVSEELGEGCAEEQKRAAARSVYNWANDEATLRIRERCDEPFVQRGTFQHLADEARIGWHPEFRSRLAQVLGA